MIVNVLSRRGTIYERSESIGHLANWAARLFARSLDRRLKPLGISLGHVPILLILNESGALSQKALVVRSAIAQPAMVALLKRMEVAGLVTRSRHPNDGRTTLFRLTQKARAQVDSMLRVLAEGNMEALVGFSAEERDALIRMLRRIISNLERHEIAELGPNGIKA